MNFKDVFKLNEDMSSKAWMIRNDGKAFVVLQHPYGDNDIGEEAIAAGEWLYSHTRSSEVKQQILETIVVWIRGDVKSTGDLIEGIFKEIDSRPYKFLSKDFVNSVKDQLVNIETKSLNISNPRSYYRDLSRNLNQEFLRARFGGVYNTNSSSKEMVFRISSTNFNWYPIIWEFVYDNKNKINSVTIVHDEESTGTFYYYKSRNGEEYNQMPLDDFINESGNPVVEGNERILVNTSLTIENPLTKAIIKSLREGKSYSDLFLLHGNKERIKEKYLMLLYFDNKN